MNPAPLPEEVLWLEARTTRPDETRTCAWACGPKGSCAFPGTTHSENCNLAFNSPFAGEFVVHLNVKELAWTCDARPRTVRVVDPTVIKIEAVGLGFFGPDQLQLRDDAAFSISLDGVTEADAKALVRERLLTLTPFLIDAEGNEKPYAGKLQGGAVSGNIVAVTAYLPCVDTGDDWRIGIAVGICGKTPLKEAFPLFPECAIGL